MSSSQALGIGCILSLFFAYWHKKERRILFFLFGVYLSLVASITLFPIDLGGEMREPGIILNPLMSWQIITSEGLFIFLKQAGGNILMFVPLPIFLIMGYGKKMNRLEVIILFSMMLSIGIEYSQLIESMIFPAVSRTIETNDVLLNTCGGIIGYYIWKKQEREGTLRLGEGYSRK